MAWYKAPTPPLRNLMRPIKYIALKIVDLCIASAYVALAAFVGWTLTPPEVKQTVQVIVDVDVDELTQTIRNLQEWAEIEVERARAER